MKRTFAPQVTLISGASRGLGAALAEELAAPGNHLVLIGRDALALESVSALCRTKGAKTTALVCDVSDRADLETLGARLDTAGLYPDLVISNAGILLGRTEGADLETRDAARAVLSVNLVGAIGLTALFLPHMLEQGRGQVLFVSSLAAFAPLADAPAYSAAKAGLLSYGLALRQALAPRGVTVQVACPGYVATPMARRHIGSRPSEISARSAARTIIRGVSRGRAVFGFPSALYGLARLSLLVPERLWWWACARLRFHVAEDR